MLLGGFYSVDFEKINLPYNEKFDFVFDKEDAYSNKIFTNNGRTSTIYALKHYELVNKKKAIVILPEYLCVSVINSIEESGFGYIFYKVNDNLEIDIEDLEEKIKTFHNESLIVYVIHYFGISQPYKIMEKIVDICESRGITIVEDITQTLFSTGKGIGIGDYIVASTRKWYPMTDGGVCAIKNTLAKADIRLEKGYNESAYRELLISVSRELYESGKLNVYEYIDQEKFANQSRYIDYTLRSMTEESKSIFFNTDNEVLIEKRRKNYEYLLEGLKDIKDIKIINESVLDSSNAPFGFLFLTDERDKMYNYLLNNGIIPEIQWKLPLEKYSPSDIPRYYSDRNIMIQCDQRYGIDDMKYIVNVIRKYYEK